MQKSTLKIYYSPAFRGANQSELEAKFKILAEFGQVLTEHMIQPNPDRGQSDFNIHESDQYKLKICDVFIADISQPSLGVGFTVCQAINMGKPVLGLYSDETKSLSAMLNGHPKIIKAKYSDLTEFKNGVQQFLGNGVQPNLIIQNLMSPLHVLLCGPGGSGKSTVGKLLEQKFGWVHVSTGELLRAIQSNLKDPLHEEVDKYVSQGELVPHQIMKQIISNRLSQTDCQIGGWILDGYPPSMLDLNNIIELDLKVDMIFDFECSDETAIARQCTRNQRSTDNPETAKKRIKIYREGIPKFYSNRYLNAPVIKINAELEQLEVWDCVQEIIKNWFVSPKKSYWLDPALDLSQVNNYRIHFHIDAEDDTSLRLLVKEILGKIPEIRGQIKLYPISHLFLGPQTQQRDCYSEMMNFHEIEQATDEQFATGGFGDNFSPEIMDKIIEIAKQTGRKYMIEIEQYLIQDQTELEFIELDQKFFQRHLDIRVKDLPNYEYHFGFDIPKTDKIPPISLSELSRNCFSQGINVGGWFIFDNPDVWKYRTNVFSDPMDKYSDCRNKLKLYEVQFKEIMKNLWTGDQLEIDFSLERVHAIWKIE